MISDQNIVQKMRMLHFIQFNMPYLFNIRDYSESSAYIFLCLLWQQVPWLCVCSAGIKVIGLQGCFRCIYIGVWKLYNNYEIVCNSNKVPLFHSSTCALCVSSLHIFNSIALSFLHLEFLIFLCNSCTSWSFDCKA